MLMPGMRYAMSSETEQVVLDLLSERRLQCVPGVTTKVLSGCETLRLERGDKVLGEYSFQIPSEYAYMSPEALRAIRQIESFWTYFYAGFDWPAAN